MDSAFPPRYVNLPAREVYHADLPDALFRTLAQIRGLAYRFKGKRTPPLTVEDLAAIRGVGRTAIFKYLAELRERGIIRTEPVGEHAFIIHLLPGQPDQAAQAGGEATPRGDRDDGPAATAARHLPPNSHCVGVGRCVARVERADAGQAGYQGLPQPGLNGCGALGMMKVETAGAPSPSPGPPHSAEGTGGTQASKMRLGRVSKTRLR
jgi:hypothetical protein